MSNGNEKKFETFTSEYNGIDTKFKVYEPTLEQQQEAMKVRNKTFRDAVDAGALLRVQLSDILKERNLWNDVKQQRYAELEQKILDGKKVLKEGGIKLKEAKDLALQMKKWRSELIDMRMPESELANQTAEGQADNASFNYLVSVCTVYYDSEEHVFNTLEDYLNRSETQISLKAARCLAALTYGVSSDIEKELPENEFLLEFGYMNDQLYLVNENGELINEDGEVIDKNGAIIVEEEEVERKPFLDDDGNEVVRNS